MGCSPNGCLVKKQDSNNINLITISSTLFSNMIEQVAWNKSCLLLKIKR